MANAARTFRIFVSSTFSDLKAERDALQALVFPRLRDLCARHGCRFQAIDLRWGVRDEAALDQQTMRICLDEVTRSQRASPKPNFIVLLGDRYGWQPLPAEIPAGEFERIAAATAATDDRVLLAAWYARDDNARVRSHEGADAEPIYCLRPRSGRFTDFAVWDRDVEQPLRRILRRGIEGLGIDANARRTFEASATEQEIAAGALKVADAGEHVFCFFRRIDGVPVDRRAADFIDLDAEGAADAGVQAKLDALRRLLEERLPGNVHAYRATWAGDGPSTAHIGSLPASLDECLALLDAADRPSSLCVDVWTRLAPVIAAEIARLETTHALEREIASHAAFAEERARVFVGRAAMLDTIARYLAGDDPHPLAVWGESGSGKSALMAKVLSEAARRHGGAAIVARFIGATPASSDGRSLVEGLCRQISRIHGADESAIPADYQGLTAELAERLKLASAERPLILLLDALDQLSDADRARGLAWLPGVLPAHVRLVVSSLPGGCKAALDTKLGAERVVKLDPMPAEEAGPLLDTWLAEAGRTLQPAQRDAVLSAFGRSAAQDAAGGAAAGPSGMPLYLRLAFEEARRWTSYTPAVNLAPDIPGVIRQLFARLRADANHGEALVSRGLGCLAASKHGLSEDEIIDVLSLDEDVRTDFMARARHTPPEARLPVIVWSRLYFDLEPYLTERVADGTSLLTFYHRQLREAAEAEFLAGPSKPMRHAQLAAYFAAPALFDPATHTPNFRKLSELPYQQALGERWADLRATLADFEFLEAKCMHAAVTLSGAGASARTVHGGIFELQEDVRRARAASPADLREHWDGWLAFLLDQAHVLSREPGLVFQQAANQAEATPAARAARTWIEAGRQSRPWLRWVNKRLTPSTCEMTLGGHANHVKVCAYSPDGSRIVSGSDDTTLRVWDASTGAMLATFAGHSGAITDGAFLPGSLDFVSASRDWTICLWDTSSGVVKRSFSGHRDAIHACAVSADGRRLVSASQDMTLRVWDVVTGETLTTLTGHTIPPTKCAFSPDGSRVVSGGWDGCVKVWDATTGAEIESLKLGFQPIFSCAFSPDGLRVAAGSAGGKLIAYELASGAEPLAFKGHSGVVRRCVFPGDGSRLVSAATDRTVRVWDARTGVQLQCLEGHGDAVFELALSPDETLAASASADATLVVWNIQDGTVVTRLLGHTGAVQACAFSPDGARLVSASDDDTLRVWHYGDYGLTVTTYGHPGGPVHACAFAPDGARAVTAAADGTLKLWEGMSGDEQATLEGHTGGVNACAYSRSGRLIVSASGDKTVRVWDAESGRPVTAITGHSHEVMDCAFSPSYDHVASASKDRTVRVADVKTGAAVHVLTGHEAIVGVCAYSPDGATILSASHDHTLRLWDAGSGALKLTLADQGAVGRTGMLLPGLVVPGSPAVFSPDGKLVASGSDDAMVRVWDAQTGEVIRILTDHSAPIVRCAFSPDGTRLLAEAGPSGVRVWDAATWDVVATLGGGSAESYQAIYDAMFEQHDYKTPAGIAREAEVRTRYSQAVKYQALASAWSPDGKLVAWSAGDKRVAVWDLQESRDVYSFHARASVTALAWSPDGKRLLLGGGGGGVQLLWLEGLGGETTSSAWDLITDLGLMMRTAESASMLAKGLEQQRKGDLAGAMDLFKQSEMASRALANKDGLAASLGNQAMILQAQGDLAGAMKQLEEVERICRDQGYKDKLFGTLGNQAVILRAMGNADGAMERHREEEALCRELGSKEGLVMSLGNQALILCDRQDLAGAMALLKEQEQLCRETGNQVGLSNSFERQALVLRQQGDLTGAMSLYKEQEKLCQGQGNIEGLAYSLANQAMLLTQIPGNADQSMALAQQAAQFAAGRPALTLELKPALEYVYGAYNLAMLSMYQAQHDEWTRRQEQYARELAAWKALPFLTRLKSKKPEPPKK